MKKMIHEFKEFISRGNVMDMAIGVILATAFGKITTSLVNEIFMPFISWIFGTRDMTALNLVVREAVMDGDTVVREGITIGFGSFLATILDFILIALVVFLLVKSMNAAKARLEKKQEAEKAAEEAAPTKEELLLMEIRDLLKERE